MIVDLNSRYGLSPAHSEVVEACKLIAPCETLDMGCSSGRNAIYLGQRGFKVTAIDTNPNAIDALNNIVLEEKIANINTQLYDINSASLCDNYGFISCTVTLMFLMPDRINAVLSNMQGQTKPGGYNLIVCAMDTKETPCPMPFPFTFKENQLREAYEGWELIKYNENLGTMHNGARLQFATMLARKTK